MRHFSVAMFWGYSLLLVSCGSDNKPDSFQTDSDSDSDNAHTESDADMNTDTEMETGSESSNYCLEAVPIHCGDQLSGTTAKGLPGLCGAYNCSAMGFSGPEAFYLFVPDQNGEVEVKLTSLSEGVQLSLFAGRECDSSSVFVNADHCAISYTSSMNSVVANLTVEAGAPQYLIIDGNNEDDAGPYTLELNWLK